MKKVLSKVNNIQLCKSVFIINLTSHYFNAIKTAYYISQSLF